MSRLNRWPAIACLSLSLIPSLALTSDALSLQEIMQGLGDDTAEMADGLLTGDFEQIAQAADAIANHPKISAGDAQLIAAELDGDEPDGDGQDEAPDADDVEVGVAARSQDRPAAVSGYQQMFEGCLACHDAYKDRVAAALAQGAEDTGD